MRRWFMLAFVAAMLMATTQAPATVAEQRARLPPPAECDDHVAGTWRAHKFSDPLWEEFTLEIRRVSGDPQKLEGTIYNHYWYGDASRQQPSACDSVQWYRARVRMPAKGTLSGDVIKFGGTSYTMEQLYCGGSSHGYNLDEFTGTIDKDKQEFQSVNNDGGQMVNHPTLFRRTACIKDGAADRTPPPASPIRITPPPIFPDASSCSCSICG